MVLLVALGLVACNKPSEPDISTGSPAAAIDTFTVLATTDLKDAQPLEKMVEDATGVKLRFKYGGTMESTEAVQTQMPPPDADDVPESPASEVTTAAGVTPAPSRSRCETALQATATVSPNTPSAMYTYLMGATT